MTSAPQPALAKTAATCGRIRQELDELLKEARRQKDIPELFTDHFFENSKARHPHGSRDELDPELPRCRDCGRTIAEHPLAAPRSDDFSFRLECTVRRAARLRNFRRHVFGDAQSFAAFDGEISYDVAPGSAITKDTALRIVLYFKAEIMAINMVTALWERLARYGVSVKEDYRGSIERSDHVCTERVGAEDIQIIDSPDRSRWATGDAIDDPISESSSKYNSRLSNEEATRETIVDAAKTFPVFKAEWAHIVARKRCRSQREEDDLANRIILTKSLHQLFDDNQSPNGIAQMTVYYTPDDGPATETTGGYSCLWVRVLFKCAEAAAALSFPRLGTIQLSSCEFKCPIEKLTGDVDRFIRYLSQRHNIAVAKWDCVPS